MTRKLDDIFNECYERIRSGESLESCLKSYPYYRAQLEPLLKTTFDIGRRVSYIHPRPAFKHWARVRLESAQHYPRQQARAETSAVPGWLRHGWAVVVSVGIVLLLTTGSTLAASSQALPTEPLYPVKLATEQVRLAFAVSDTNKAQVETDIVEIRAAELEAIAHSGNTEEAVKSAQRYSEQWERASAAIAKVEGIEVPPVIIPPTESLPPTSTTATPSTETTPPASTTATPSTETTPPASTTATPSTETTPPTVSTASENKTATETATPTTSEQPTTTSEQPTTTYDKNKAAKTGKLRKSLDDSTSKSLSALQDAKGNASERAKVDLQKAIDNIKKSHQSHDTASQSGNTKGKQGNKSTGGTNKTTVQSDNKTTSGTHSYNHNQPSTSNTVSNHR